MRLLPCLMVLALAAPAAAASTPSPRRVVAEARAEWLQVLRASARDGDSARTFPSPSRRVLLQRLKTAARLHDFRIVRVRMLRPLQRAPAIVIRSDRELAIARATAKIIDIFDPRHPTSKNPSGYAYEGYFFVAETSKGVPYLATSNHWRAPHVDGGEWAASKSLYPFPHG